MLIQFSTKTTQVLYVGQVEEKETFTHNVKVIRRQGEISQFPFYHKNNTSETAKEGIVAKVP